MMQLLALLAASLAVGAAGAAPAPSPSPPSPPSSSSPNMNGEYTLNPTPKQVLGKFPTNYADYPGPPVEYFDVYSPPITSTYAEIFWKTLDTVPLPPAIVKRFAGRPMAVVGLEWDQVRRTSNGDVSVPMNVAYNHHYGTTLLGSDSMLVQVDATDPRVPPSDHGPALDSDGKVVVAEDLNPNSAVPNTQAFFSQNGGEARLSFKGYAPGYAKSIMSPANFSITVMQIDTWNRDKMNLTGPTKFEAGPYPRNSYAKPSDPYSGLLECPMTSRVTKELDADYVVELHNACSDEVTSEAECSAVVAQLALPGFNTTAATVNDASLPAGCSFAVNVGARLLKASYNIHTTAPAAPPPIASTAPTATPLCGHGLTALVGVEKGLVELKLNLEHASPNATFELTGPDGVWFGVGFDAKAMGDAPWTVVVDGAGEVTERRLGNHAPGTLLPRSVRVLSNTVAAGGNRTVVLTRKRSLPGAHFNFSLSETTIPFISAVGSGPHFAIHKSAADSILTMLATDAPNCVCAKDPPPFGQGGGHFMYEDGSRVKFRNLCKGEVLEQRNPTCDLRTYTGGIQSCVDTWRLLDKEQPVPWQDQPLVYQHKFRFWFQDFAEQKEPMHFSWHLGAATGEYDVPKCPAGTATADCIHRLEGTQLIPEENAYLVALKSHCHSGTCLTIQVYYNDTGELLCDQRSVFGEFNPNPRFAEPGYINRPPCLWGDAEYGLEPPPKVGGRVLRAVAITNATNGHHGEMGIPVLFTVSEP